VLAVVPPPVTVRVPAKVNLHLAVGDRRGDGYHDLTTVFQALSLTGNHGLARTNPLQRHYRDVLCGRVHTPQDDATRTSLGRLALNL